MTSNTEIFFPLKVGKIRNAKVKAKPKWIALAGRPLNIPILNIKGKGEAYQSWNKDQMIAIAATTFKCKPERFLVGDKSSLILLLTFLLIPWFIFRKDTLLQKKRPDKNIRPFNLIN